jgi:hypothetical protein
MNDILGRIINDTKDTILIRALHFVNKYLHGRVERRLKELIRAPKINIRMIYEYNTFMLMLQHNDRHYFILPYAQRQLVKYHPKCLLHCCFYHLCDPYDGDPAAEYYFDRRNRSLPIERRLLAHYNYDTFLSLYLYHRGIRQYVKHMDVLEYW